MDSLRHITQLPKVQALVNIVLAKKKKYTALDFFSVFFFNISVQFPISVLNIYPFLIQ